MKGTTEPRLDAQRGPELATPVRNILKWLDSVPYALLALPLRLAVATVFWNSGMAKLANWDTTVYMFAEEYQVPILPPELAASMAFAIRDHLPATTDSGFAHTARGCRAARHDCRHPDLRLSRILAHPHPMGRDVARAALPRRRHVLGGLCPAPTRPSGGLIR